MRLNGYAGAGPHAFNNTFTRPRVRPVLRILGLSYFCLEPPAVPAIFNGGDPGGFLPFLCLHLVHREFGSPGLCPGGFSLHFTAYGFNMYIVHRQQAFAIQ